MLNIFKESLKYPFNDISKVGILAVIIFVFSIIMVIVRIITGIITYGFYSPFIEEMSLGGMIISLLLGIIVLLIESVFLIFLYGYEYRIINFAINKSPMLPEYIKFKEMFKDGLNVFIAIIGYSLIFIIILYIIGLIEFFINSALPINLQIIPFIIFGLIKLAIFIILPLLFIIGIPHMINNQGKLGKAFNFEEIYGVIKQIGLGKYVAMIILNLIALALFFSPILIGIILVALEPIFFILLLVLWFIYLVIIGPYLFFFESRLVGSIYAQKDEYN